MDVMKRNREKTLQAKVWVVKFEICCIVAAKNK